MEGPWLLVVRGGLDASMLFSVAHWAVLGVVLYLNLSSGVDHALCGVLSLLHKRDLAIFFPESGPGPEVFPEFGGDDLFFENDAWREFEFYWALCASVDDAPVSFFPSVSLDVDLSDFDGAFLALVSSFGGRRVSVSEELAAGHAGADFDADWAILGFEAGDGVEVVSALACGVESFLRLCGSGKALLVSSGVRAFGDLFFVFLAGISLIFKYYLNLI